MLTIVSSRLLQGNMVVSVPVLLPVGELFVSLKT
jgi:hypothetical protein